MTYVDHKLEEAWAMSSYREALRERRENQQAWVAFLTRQAQTYRSLAEDCEERANRVAAARVDDGLDLKIAPGRAEMW